MVISTCLTGIFFFFFLNSIKATPSACGPIYGLVLLYKSVLLILYILGPCRASVAAGASFPDLSKRWCSLPEACGLLIECSGLELVDQSE